MRRFFDILFIAAGIALLALFTTRYRMPFRLDDVLLMLWAQSHSAWAAFDPIKGQMVNSFRPMFSLAAYFLTHFAGWNHPFWWHLTLDASLLTGITFTGLTARYLIGRWQALQISILLYFIAFLSVLNIFFWYSDLTYGLEMAFTASAWYFGLRGLYEGRIRFWIAGIVLGSAAVLSKEPAVVLVHSVFAGSFILERNEITSAWKQRTRFHRKAASLLYLFLIALTVWIAVVSPTKGNRFFPFDTPNLPYFVRDRIGYYSAVYLSSIARILLFFPMVYAFLRILLLRQRNRFGVMEFLLFTVLGGILALILFQNILVAMPVVILIFVTLGTLDSPEKPIVRRLLPFVASVAIAMAALLVTIQLVKTQLTEAALLTAMLSAWAWCRWIEDVRITFRKPWKRPLFRWIVGTSGAVVLCMSGILFLPRIRKEERLLRDVRAVRQNANDGVSWAAFHLPPHASFAVTTYLLYGIDGPDALTPKDDETKLADQYTFADGFVFDALKSLNRNDFVRTYLSDSLLLPHVLDAMRERPKAYVFLQSKLDWDRFHGSTGTSGLLSSTDSLVARFSLGPYPSEIWMLRKK